jgi:hypothetical protein
VQLERSKMVAANKKTVFFITMNKIIVAKIRKNVGRAMKDEIFGGRQ